MAETYFAAKPSDEAAAVILSKALDWMTNLRANGYLEKLRMSWAAYHGAYYDSSTGGHKITFSGTNEELVNIPVNNVRNLAQHILVMTTATRPSMDARATNTDYKSLTQTLLANGLLDYYMREKRLERYLKTAVEYAVVMGSGYVKLSWNAMSGEMYEFNEETSTPIYEGDVEFSNLSPFDVVVDSTKEHQDHDWIICRTWKNRFDLAAKYPELKDKIIGLATKDKENNFRVESLGFTTTDDVAVYEFYHKRSEALPDGRYLLFLATDIVLYDGPMPYRNLPIFRISPSDILGTPYGYTNIFDLLPLQEALNSLFSTVITNQSAFGVQNVIVPRGADIAISQLAGGLNIIECNTQAGVPSALNLTQTPPEVFNMITLLNQTMETLSGVNSVARGNPEASLKSGTALALVQSMAIQFMSGLQGSYVALIEDVGTALINVLKDFAAVPRVAAIVGRSNRTFMKEFKGDDLSAVSRVIVDVGNPLAKTTAGRVQMAEQMLQMGIIKNPQQYFTVINTGKLDVMFEGDQAELLLIKGENEQLMRGEESIVLSIDEHKTHILEHKAILSDPELRKDAALVGIVLNHIQGHIDALRTTNPDLLMQLNQQPLQPPQQAGVPPAPGSPQSIPQGASAAGPMEQPQQGVEGMKSDGSAITGPGIPEGVNLPNQPTVPATLLPNPALEPRAQ